MNRIALLAVGLSILAGCAGNDEHRDGGAVSQEFAPPSRVAQWSNLDWQKVLTDAVTDDGLVRYDLLTANANNTRDALFRYVALINDVSPVNRPDLFPTDDDRLAYYLNAYNALALYGVLQKGLPANVLLSGLFQAASFPVGQRRTTLDALETRHVRPSGDPRTHFALCSMTQSSPPLRKEPYKGPLLDEQLADQAERSLNDPRMVYQKMRGAKVRLSEMLTKFYPNDFLEAFSRATGDPMPSLVEALRPFAAENSPVQTATEYETMPFDWAPNAAQ